MAKKWIWKIIYIIFIGAITVLVSTFSEAAKVVNFLRDNEESFMSDHRKLISATVIANEHNQTDVYISNQPLFIQEFSNEFTAVTVSIYPLVQFRKDEAQNAIAILLTDLKITDSIATKDEDDYHKVFVELSFDRNLEIGNGKQSVFNEFMIPLYDDTGRMIVIKEELLQTNTGLALLESLIFTYQVASGNQILLTLFNSELIDLEPNDPFDLEISRDIKTLTEENLDLLSSFGLIDLEENSEIFYDPNIILEFKTYNKYYYRYIGIELAIVLPLTYLIFFHRHIRRIIREKKYNINN